MIKTENKDLVGMLESIHLLRKLFLIRISGGSPLHFGQMPIMRTIASYENCTQAAIAEHLGVSPASVATSTKRLQKAGLITKTVDPDNLRCNRLALTDKGRKAIEQQLALFYEYDSLIFDEFSQDEKAQLLSLLSRIVRKMQEIEGIEGGMPAPHELVRTVMEKLKEGSDEIV